MCRGIRQNTASHTKDTPLEFPKHTLFPSISLSRFGYGGSAYYLRDWIENSKPHKKADSQVTEDAVTEEQMLKQMNGRGEFDDQADLEVAREGEQRRTIENPKSKHAHAHIEFQCFFLTF